MTAAPRAPRPISELAPFEMSAEDDARYSAMIEEADRDVDEIRTSLRQQRDQIQVIQRAAKVYGRPYQTYLKQAAVRQALADLKVAQDVGVVSVR